MRSLAVATLLLSVASVALAEESVVYNEPTSVSKAEGLEAWARIFEVASHPRCANCHVGPSERPMWSGPSYGDARPHGMNVHAGASRIGAESGLMCNTCHVNSSATERANSTPHAAPHISGVWRLAPVEADWYGKDSQFICEQLRDPKRNGGRDYRKLAFHLGHDKILHWAWTPGGNREAAPRTLQDHIDDMFRWGVAGMPCPGDTP
ncbi:MAG: hypothetical protein AAFU77_02345 [Myxococcota bacterium]